MVGQVGPTRADGLAPRISGELMRPNHVAPQQLQPFRDMSNHRKTFLHRIDAKCSTHMITRGAIGKAYGSVAC